MIEFFRVFRVSTAVIAAGGGQPERLSGDAIA
jgi:hypothetical protein